MVSIIVIGQNLINFMEKQLKPNHGFLFNILTKNIKVRIMQNLIALLWDYL